MQFIPEDLTAEALYSYLPDGTCKIRMKGLHRRNANKDIAGLESLADPSSGQLLQIGRNGLYASLPEVLFHQVDRFSNLPAQQEKERFAEEYELQEQEKSDAQHFFSPIDLMLFLLRADLYQRFAGLAEHNSVLEKILGDQLTPRQRENRFIRELLHFLPACKTIRGNKTLLTLMLRKVLLDEDITLRVKEVTGNYTDAAPRYAESVGSTVGEVYAGTDYSERVIRYDLHYWPSGPFATHFLDVAEEIEGMRLFVQDYFLGVEEEMHIDLSYNDITLLLADNEDHQYLGYNTNL